MHVSMRISTSVYVFFSLKKPTLEAVYTHIYMYVCMYVFCYLTKILPWRFYVLFTNKENESLEPAIKSP